MSFAVTSRSSQAPDPFLIAADLLDPPEDPTSLDAPGPEAFIEEHCTIEEPDGTVIPFKLWDFQRDVVRALHAGDPVIVLKARRLGLSWVVLAFALWLAIFQQGVRVLVLCKNQDDAAELLDRIRRMRDRIATSPKSGHLLDGLRRPAKERDAVTTLDVGASTIRALVGTPAAARSETAGLVILDEFGFQRRAAEIWRAIWPTIEGGGRLALISTGNGPEQHPIGGEFARLWARSVEGLSGLVSFFFPWQSRPDRDEAWKQRTVEALGDPERFKTEYPEEPGDAFLSPDADLVYDRTHLAAATRMGAELDALPPGQQPRGPLYLGIDWGVNTHMLLARELPSGGLWVVREVFSHNADIEQDVQALTKVLRELGETPQMLRYDPGAAGAKVIGSFAHQMQDAMPGFRPKVMKIPFSKFKVVAIRYAKLLLRRAHEGQELRFAAISPTGAPELLRQMALAEWKDPDAGKTEKGDDHGSDALLTLTAEPGFRMYGNDVNTDEEG